MTFRHAVNTMYSETGNTVPSYYQCHMEPLLHLECEWCLGRHVWSLQCIWPAVTECA